MAVHRSGHLASGQQGGDLLLRRHKLPRLGLLQRLADKVGVFFDLGARMTLPHPESGSTISLLSAVVYLYRTWSDFHCGQYLTIFFANVHHEELGLIFILRRDYLFFQHSAVKFSILIVRCGSVRCV